MIRIFNGKWRGPGNAEDRIGMLLEFEFRKILNQFKGTKLAVFLAISLHADKDGVSFPSYDLLEKETGYTRASVAKALKELCKAKIEGHPVLYRVRYRDKDGKFAGSNRYLIFPTPEEIQSLENKLSSSQSLVNPTLEKPNGGKSEPEVKPEVKVKPEDKEEEGPPNIYQLYEDTFGLMTGSIGDRLTALEEDFALYWIKDAFGIAKENDAKSLKYVETVLSRWTKEGKDNGYKQRKKKGVDTSAFDQVREEMGE